ERPKSSARAGAHLGAAARIEAQPPVDEGLKARTLDLADEARVGSFTAGGAAQFARPEQIEILGQARGIAIGGRRHAPRDRQRQRARVSSQVLTPDIGRDEERRDPKLRMWLRGDEDLGVKDPRRRTEYQKRED